MRLLAMTETPDHVCGRYRVRAFAPALAAAGWDLTVQGIATTPLARLRQFDRAREFDAVLLQRKLLPRWQTDFLRGRCRRLLFDFDDAILYRDSNDPRGPHCPRRARRFKAVVQLADMVIAGNDFLADCALRSGTRADDVRVIPTCIATERYAMARPRPSDDGIQLAWIGSSSTLKGLEKQARLWSAIGEQVPGARLRLICDRFPNFGPLALIPIRWQEETEADELARADVGISWIPDDLWSQGKCGLKVLQYMAAGLPAIANPVGVHPDLIRSGITGFLATSVEEWVDAVRTLRDDPSMLRTMGMAARAAVEAGYSVTAWGRTFVAAIEGPTALPSPKYRRRKTGVTSISGTTASLPTD